MFKIKTLAIKKVVYANLPIKIGTYGILSLIIVCMFLYFVLEKKSTQASLPSFWQFGGELRHLLGTTQAGDDLFYLLLLAYKNSFIAMILTSISILIFACILSYLMNHSKILNCMLTWVLDLLKIIPAFLTVIALVLFFSDYLYLILLAIGLSFLPHFIQDLNKNLVNIKQKDYFLVDKLEGFSSQKLFFMTVLPNIYIKLCIHFIALSTQIFLTIMVITFFQFIQIKNNTDLGRLMFQVLAVYEENPWPFFSCGLMIMLTILFSHLIALGLEKIDLAQGNK